jgi:hypothetical protein
MSELIQYLRQQFPKLDQYGYSDEEVSLWYADKTGGDRREVGELLGVYDPDQGNFSRGVDSAIDSTQAMGYGAGALIADTVGATDARNSMLRGYQQNMAQVEQRARPTDSYENINSVGDALDFASYYSGYGLAQGAQAIATGGLGSLVGKQVVKQGIKRQAKDLLSDSSQAAIQRGGKVGGYGGFGAQAVGTELGATYGGAVDRALETGQSIDDINLGKVYGYGTAAGLMEGVADVATAGLARVGPAKSLMQAATKSRARGLASGAAKGAAVEGFTEGVQTGLEDLGAGYSREEARFFDPTAVLAGAIGGGQLGGAGGFLQRPQNSETDLNETAEVAKDRIGEQLQLDLDDPSTPEQLEARRVEAQNAAEAQAKAAKSQLDADNEVFRVEAQAFTRDDFKKQLNAGLELSVDDRTSDLGREFIERINTPTEENPRGLLDPKDIKAARTKFVKEKTEAQAGTLNAAYEAELERRVAEKLKNQNQIELDFDQKTQQEKQQAEVDKPALSATKAIEQTERMFGKDWIASGKYEALEAAVNAPKFNRKKYAEELDKAVNVPTPTPVNTLTEEASTTTAEQTPDAKGRVQAAIEAIAPTLEKAPQQKAVFETFTKSLFDNQMDKYIQVNIRKGQKYYAINYQDLADDAGLTGKNSRTNANNAMKRIMPKLNTALGLEENDTQGLQKLLAEFVTERKPETQSQPPVDADAPTNRGVENKADADEVLDPLENNNEAADEQSAFELGRSAVISAGAGNYRGVRKEDKAFTRERRTTDEEVTATAEQQNAETRKADEAEVARLEPLLKSLWGKQTDTEYDALSMDQKVMWMRSAMEYAFTKDADAINNDLNDVLAMDTQDQTEATNETTEPSDTGRNAQTEERVQSEPPAPVQEAESSGGQTDTATGTDGSQSGNQEAKVGSFDKFVEKRRKVNEINVRQFKESYENDIDAFRANPDLAEPAAFADYLYSLTDAQWEKLTPVFANDYNPFKAPSMDVDQIRGFVDNALNEKKPAKKAKKAKQPTATNRLMPSSFVTGQAFVADVYHGTTTDIQEFDATMLGDNTGAGSAQEAFFFGGKPETANSYAENPSKVQEEATFNRALKVSKKFLAGEQLTETEQKVLAGMLKRAKEIDNGEVVFQALVDTAKQQPKNPTPARSMAQRFKPIPQPNVQIRRIRMSNPLVHDYKGATTRGITYLQLIKNAKENGHDGVVMLNTYDRAGKTKAELTEADMDNIFAVFDTSDITNTFKVREDNTKFGIPMEPKEKATREAFEQEVKNLTGSTTNMRIHVFDTEAEAISAIEDGSVPAANIDQLKKAKPYGWVIEDENGEPHAHFILERVSAGREKSAFLHEVGGHVGIDTIIDPDDQRDIAAQIYDWAEKKDDSLESQIARRAIARINYATLRGGVSDGAIISEAVAYFLEEASIAGVDPSVNTTVAQFVKKLRDLFVAALDKIGFGQTDTLTAQDIVDMAYGAARVELMHGLSDTNVQNPVVTPSLTAARYGVVSREWVGDKLGGPNAVKAYDTAAEIGAKAASSLKFVHNIVRDNRERMPALGRWYDAMLKVEATRNEIKQSFQEIAKQARTLTSERLARVNKFLGESTFDQEWGYDPKVYHPDLFADKKIEVNESKRIQFERLSDAEKQFVADIFAHGERMRQRKIALAKKLGVAGKFFTDASLEGPYAPLKRFGNYAGELKSGRLAEAERAAKAAGATKKQKELYEKLKSDRNHYVISFFDTMGAAKQFIDENKKSYAFSQASERAPNIESDRISNPEVYEKVMGALAASNDASMDSGAKTAFREMVRGMYFQAMDERSARTSGAKRLNRAGYEQNMVRSFLSHANSEASLIAQMENGTEVNTAFAEAGNQTLTKTGEVRDPDKQRVFNSIAGHYKNTLTRNETPIQDQITTMNSVYMLLTSVGYHLTNATQPMMVSVPRIAGDFGNYGNAWSAMFRGYKYSRAAAKIGLNMETEIDLEKVPQEYRALLKNLQDRNLIDQGMEEDGSFDRFNTGFEALNRASDVLGTVTTKLYNVAKFVEAQNRISTAVAAYDAARANPTKLAAMKMTPEQYATAVVEDTQGNFSQLDAPLLIKSLPKVVTQYRKYQLLMAWHYSSAFKQGFFGESPEMKAAGKRILAYSVGHAAMGAGATGVPLLTTAFWLATFLGDEDEPQDMERWIKENIDDGAFGQALSRGVFSTFGLDLSTKLNQAKIFHPLPYVDFEAGEEGARNIIMGAVGPAGTTGVNFFRAAEYYGQGDLLKGIEYSMPKGIRSVAESYRLATDGMTTKSGTIVVDPRELDVASLLINAMGTTCQRDQPSQVDEGPAV